MHPLGFIIFVSFMMASIAEILKCNDILTRRAIEKRGRQINLKCLENKKQLEKCNNRTAVDSAWMDFEQINANYFTTLDSCKEGKRKKRHFELTSHFLDFRHDNLGLNHDLKRKLDGNRVKRNVHGTSDDKNNPEVENDYSGDFRRFKRNECLKDSEKEKTRLLEKFAKSCKPDTTYDRGKMSKSCKDNLDKLSKARYRAYSNYVGYFRLCYGSIS
ncbi:hypothetical protein LOAG_06994 [Loa loa]|uniref:Uncharacterized protein n=2 Tax=Loa loa TaxID=7209 RepID=A0A1S0TWP3_LOALO|nr:hypothetical protein LOAG_06994 [Loa loa]EFO21493.2 hypothetical protein LOAG_06994 [Loa loa]